MHNCTYALKLRFSLHQNDHFVNCFRTEESYYKSRKKSGEKQMMQKNYSCLETFDPHSNCYLLIYYSLLLHCVVCE